MSLITSIELPTSQHVVHTTTNGKGKRNAEEEEIAAPEEKGIWRFKVIGTKNFLHDDEELDKYLDHVLEWWRGERRPEGVPLERAYRCS